MISVCKIHYECISSGLSSLPTAKTFCNSSPAVRSGGREVEGGGGGGWFVMGHEIKFVLFLINAMYNIIKN